MMYQVIVRAFVISMTIAAAADTTVDIVSHKDARCTASKAHGVRAVVLHRIDAPKRRNLHTHDPFMSGCVIIFSTIAHTSYLKVVHCVRYIVDRLYGRQHMEQRALERTLRLYFLRRLVLLISEHGEMSIV